MKDIGMDTVEILDSLKDEGPTAIQVHERHQQLLLRPCLRR